MSDKTIFVHCAIAGGGPAGMVAGLLLARAGLSVVVLEKHADFLRDFRGDTIHPSTLELMYELGFLSDLLELPHQEARVLNMQFGNRVVRVADFSHVPAHCRFIAFMPQWDFLNFLAERAASYPTFQLRMRTQASDLIETEGRIIGMRADGPGGALEIRADLVIGADGRHSGVRERAGLQLDELGAPLDVAWFKLPRKQSDPEETTVRFDTQRVFIRINRGDEWQCGFGIPKGSFEQIRLQGLESFRGNVATVAPFAADRVETLRDWDDIKLLTVLVDRLRQWYRPGLLCIGDAAHAMSPIGGVGINLAIQDAVAAANELASPLENESLTVEHLRKVQRRREPPTRLIQGLQVFLQNQFVSRVLGSTSKLAPPLPLKLADRFSLLRRIPGWLIGIGIRPEHVRTPLIPTRRTKRACN